MAEVYETPSAPAPVKKKRSKLLVGCLSVFALLVVCGGLNALLNPGGSTGTPTAVAVVPTVATGAVAVADVPTEAPEPTEAAAATEVPAEPTPEPTEAPVVTEAPVALVVGQDITVGEVRWKILEVIDQGPELTADNEFIEPKTTAGKWVRIRLEIENLSKEQLNFTGVDITDNQDRTFQSSSEAFMHIPTEEACPFEQLSANVPKTCQLVYELPADAVGLKAKVGDLKLFGGDEALIDLGL